MSKFSMRVAAAVGSLLFASVLTAVSAQAAPSASVETVASDTGAGIKSAAVSGLRGVSSYRGTGVPSDVRAYGATPVADGHKIAGLDFQTQSIIGPDNRIRVNPTTGFPARATVLITRTVNGVESQHCSGWMYSPTLVLTAGHCVFNGTSWYTGQLRFYPGANGFSYPYGSCTASQLLSNTGWTVNHSQDADYGGAKLNCTIGNATGWYGSYWQTASLNGTPSVVQGYPGDKAQQQWVSYDQIRISDPLRLYYDNDTVGGNSGSPVYTNRPAGSPGCAGQCFLAWHAYGGSHNSGARLTESRFNLIAGWR
ncbi:extracellular metalloprotease [Lentzea sp. NBRC 105346]|uniref:trypsin-like serine peptidase n=1 Tax=Lentzea sp. NBRC 105346 TaxID=3032205 RepID=UPI0024A31ACE|nr:hypothetical protein [Lentzea sp. NBRC 105346]GLZ35589.1 extracellular metalloprotease [Lentzea sp. NBRC 105346]